MKTRPVTLDGMGRIRRTTLLAAIAVGSFVVVFFVLLGLAELIHALR